MNRAEAQALRSGVQLKAKLDGRLSVHGVAPDAATNTICQRNLMSNPGADRKFDA